MTCARVDCGRALTRRQLRNGCRHCSRQCVGIARRRPLDAARPTHCRACGTALTWAQARDGEHCSLSCVMRTRHGRSAPTRTTCKGCSGPLTRRQQWRRRDFCSKSCAKVWLHEQQPHVLAAQGQQLQVYRRAQFLPRLRAFLLACPSPLAAAQRGWRNGWSAAARASVRNGHRRGHWQHGERQATLARIAETAPSKAEAYRQAYRAAWDCCWRRAYARRTAA